MALAHSHSPGGGGGVPCCRRGCPRRGEGQNPIINTPQRNRQRLGAIATAGGGPVHGAGRRGGGGRDPLRRCGSWRQGPAAGQWRCLDPPNGRSTPGRQREGLGSERQPPSAAGAGGPAPRAGCLGLHPALPHAAQTLPAPPRGWRLRARGARAARKAARSSFSGPSPANEAPAPFALACLPAGQQIAPRPSAGEQEFARRVTLAAPASVGRTPANSPPCRAPKGCLRPPPAPPLSIGARPVPAPADSLQPDFRQWAEPRPRLGASLAAGAPLGAAPDGTGAGERRARRARWAGRRRSGAAGPRPCAGRGPAPGRWGPRARLQAAVAGLSRRPGPGPGLGRARGAWPSCWLRRGAGLQGLGLPGWGPPAPDGPRHGAWGPPCRGPGSPWAAQLTGAVMQLPPAGAACAAGARPQRHQLAQRPCRRPCCRPRVGGRCPPRRWLEQRDGAAAPPAG